MHNGRKKISLSGLAQIKLFIFTFISLFFGVAYSFLTDPNEKISSSKIESNQLGKSDTYLNKTSSKSKNSNKNEIEREFVESKITYQVNKIENEPSVLFNDPAISQAWGLKKTDIARAWSVTKGSRDVIVAIIDTGIDTLHEDLGKNLWVNPGESGKDKYGKDKSSNGIDDDGNGYIDDIHGWNFVSNNNDLTDNHGHGDHIAGIIGAEAGNGKGIVGISPNVSLMILKYFDPKKPGDNLKNTIRSIHYAIEKGAHIINYSGGGTEFSNSEFEAVKLASSKGILFVAAAGNERSNSDKFHYYPADYKLPNVISVTAIDPNTEVLSTSNYGVETVDIAAPGQNIISTLPGNTYGPMTGTSQATAFVSGCAALVMAHKKSFKAIDVRKYILETGDAVSSLYGKTRYARQLNMFKALTILDKGTTATGAIAVNTENMKEKFTSNPSENKVNLDDDPSRSRFGRNLIDAIRKGIKSETKERVGTQQD